MSEFTPQKLCTIADTVSGRADSLRTIAVRLVLVAATTRWHSPAAGYWRTRAHDAALALRQGAGKLDFAAEQIRLHATRVALASAKAAR